MLVQLAAVAAAAAAAAGRPGPNVLVLFADDMGVADLGVLGHPTISSPHLDRLANEGVRFTAWYSGFHICSPSRAAMLTGRLCVRSGTCGAKWTGGVFSNKPVGGLPQNETTFATALKSAGYRTAAVGKWHLGSKPEFMPLGHGFDKYLGIPYSVDMGMSAWNRGGEFPPLPIVEDAAVVQQPADLDTLSTRYGDFAVAFIAEAAAAAEPFLLYFAFNHVHTPDFVSPAYCGKSRRGLFGDAVAELDGVVGRVMAAVAAAGQRENTITFFTSDNGPWTSHALLGGSAGPFRDGKGSVWEGGVREPGFVHWPGTILPRIEAEPVATYDIFPTVLALASVPLPADRQFDGKDLTPLLLNRTSKSPHECIFYWKGCTDKKLCGVPADSPLTNHVDPGLWAVRCGEYKTHFIATNQSCSVHYMPPGFYQEDPLIYRLDMDPSERFPLAPGTTEYAEQLAKAKAAVAEHIASLSPAVNQISLGSDARIQQAGGAAICGCPQIKSCICDPASLNATVCPEGRPNAPDERRSGNAPDERRSGKTARMDEVAGATAPTPPNVVIFFVDDSGYGDWGVYGAPSTETPNMDRMAAEGARFTQWYSAHAICTPSRAALMTGRLPIRYGLASTRSGGQSVFTCQAEKGMPASETTVAELLKGRGYDTMMVGKWHLGSTAAFLPTAHGFDSYLGIPYSVDMGFAWGNRTEESWSEGSYYGCTPLPMLANTTVVEQPVDLSTVHARYTAAAVDFVSARRTAPFFLYFAFGHVHTPQYAGPAQRGRSKRGIFGDSVAEVDASVGAVLDALAGSNTLAILSSDNGAPDAHQHLQPGQRLEAITGSNHMFLGSKTQTWDGGLREPGLVWWPGVIKPQVRPEVASTLDVFATVAEAAGARIPAGRVYDSFSLLPLLTGRSAAPPRNASFFYAGATLQAVRVGAYKAHLVTQPPNEPHAGPERGFLPQSHSDHQPYGVQDPWLLFDVEVDPSEMYPIGRQAAAPILAALIAPAVASHRKVLGTPPAGVLSDTCDVTVHDCRVCCDHEKQCSCSAPPSGLAAWAPSLITPV